MIESDNLLSRFRAMCQRRRIPRDMRQPIEMIGGFLATVESGQEPNIENQRATIEALAAVKGWIAAA